MIIAINNLHGADAIKEASLFGVQWLGLNFVSGSPHEIKQVSSLAGLLPDAPPSCYAEVNHPTALLGIFRDEMPQTIVTRIYNFNLSAVRLDGMESPVLIDNLRRTVTPDICPGLTFVKTLNVNTKEDIVQAKLYDHHADYLLFNMGTNPWEWLNAYDGETPFLISVLSSADDIQRINSFHHQRMAGYSVEAQTDLEEGGLKEQRLRLMIEKIKELR